MHPDDRQRVLGLVQDLLTGSVEKAAAEYRYQHPQRGLIWINHLARALERDAAGQVVRMNGVVRDITERKNAEEELKRLRLDLEPHFMVLADKAQIRNTIYRMEYAFDSS